MSPRIKLYNKFLLYKFCFESQFLYKYMGDKPEFKQDATLRLDRIEKIFNERHTKNINSEANYENKKHASLTKLRKGDISQPNLVPLSIFK